MVGFSAAGRVRQDEISLPRLVGQGQVDIAVIDVSRMCDAFVEYPAVVDQVGLTVNVIIACFVS